MCLQATHALLNIVKLRYKIHVFMNIGAIKWCGIVEMNRFNLQCCRSAFYIAITPGLVFFSELIPPLFTSPILRCD